MKFPTTRWTVATVLVVAVAVSACGLLGGKPRPGLIMTINYGPFGGSFRGVSIARTTQHFDEHGTETDFGVEYFVRSNISQAQGAFEATFVLDSVLLLPGAAGGITEQQVDSARGVAFQATLAPNGRLTNFVGGETAGILGREIADRALKAFLPMLPERGVYAAARWADTVDTRMTVNGLDNSIHLINEHYATGWTVHAGHRTLRILSVSNYTFNASGSQSGRAFTVSGRGRRHIHSYVSEDGRFLGLVSNDTSIAEARLADPDFVIPIQQTRIDSLLIW